MAALEEDQPPTTSDLQRLADRIDEEGGNTREYLDEQLGDRAAADATAADDRADEIKKHISSEMHKLNPRSFTTMAAQIEEVQGEIAEQFEDMEARLRRLGETANYVKVNADGDPLDDDDDDDDDEEALLGEGSFGKLLRMKHIPENALRAVKVIKISKAKSDGCSLDKLLSEAHILNMLTHESIVRYWGHLFCGTVKNPALQKCKLVAHNNKNRNSSAAA